MLLKSLSLHNIRSYSKHTVEFPSGSVLLSGDIGSGKSTILLALEFALFGVKASELPGSMLLRNGKAQGKVSLSFEIDGTPITIERALKRTKNGVTQEPGRLIKDGVAKEATATELRSMMFEYLGYPQDLVTKSKDLIYRYTVYTPQEALKDILFEKPEDRLDTLRRVFTIDKYKRIRENTVILLSHIKDRRKELEGYTSDLIEKRELKTQFEKQIHALRAKEKEIKPKVAELQVQFSQKKLLWEQAERDVLALQQQKQQLASISTQIDMTIRQFQTSKQDLERVEQQVAEHKPAELTIDSSLSEQIIQLKKKIDSHERENRANYSKVQTLQTQINTHEQTKKKITQLDQCPLCDQQVTHEHKTTISTREDNQIAQIKQQQATCAKRQEEIEKESVVLRQQLDELEKKRRDQDLVVLKKQNYELQLQRKKDLEESIAKLKQEVGKGNAQKAQLQQGLHEYDAKESLWKTAKQDYEKTQEEHRHLELALLSVQKEAEGVVRQVQQLTQELLKKDEAITELGLLKQRQHWLSSFFINLMHSIEKQVMVRINIEFNEFFKQWFSTIMEDETISVRIDDEFTPIVEQNGYETSLHNLSGGEKTSVALAYRLALHKVINDVVSEIKTKDLLILDEPTDGFSTEQLDNVRQVLDAINVGQLIVVSHEAKIESYVDHVLRVSKRDHQSVVTA